MTGDIASVGQIGDRFPTNEQIQNMVDKGHPLRLVVPGEPHLSLFVTEGGRSIGLELPPDEIPIDLSPYTFLDISGGSDYAHIWVSCSRPRLFPEFMRLMAGIAERVQVQKQSSGHAIAESIAAWQEILDRARGLSHETELGLLGELWTAWRLIVGGIEPSAVVQGWRGSAGEEHDFGLAGIDLEVKTTETEQRVHWISSLTQMVPTGDRPLWLVSVQFTSAGSAGRTLEEYVSIVRGVLPPEDATVLRRFDQGVNAVIGELRRSPGRSWILRSPSRVIPVDGAFPRLTPTLLSSMPEQLRTRVSDVRYRIEVDGLGEEDGDRGANTVLGQPPKGDSPWT